MCLVIYTHSIILGAVIIHNLYIVGETTHKEVNNLVMVSRLNDITKEANVSTVFLLAHFPKIFKTKFFCKILI